MIVTKQNGRFIREAIAQVSELPVSQISYGTNAVTDELVILEPSGLTVDDVALTAVVEELKAQGDLTDLRNERNRLLAETDWWANSDLTMTPEQTAYRQALRDITETYSSLDDVVWPEKP